MKRAGIVLVLAVLLLSGCATDPQTKETVSPGFQETVESYESAESSEDKQIKVSNQVWKLQLFAIIAKNGFS